MSLPEPFDKGIWILCSLFGKDVIAKVEDEDNVQSEESLTQELLVNKCVCVTLRKKYVITHVQFPIRGPSGEFSTGGIVSVSKHEMSVDLFNEFPTHAALTAITFLSEIDKDDIDVLRVTVKNAEQGMEMTRRAQKANITLAK